MADVQAISNPIKADPTYAAEGTANFKNDGGRDQLRFGYKGVGTFNMFLTHIAQGNPAKVTLTYNGMSRTFGPGDVNATNIKGNLIVDVQPTPQSNTSIDWTYYQ